MKWREGGGSDRVARLGIGNRKRGPPKPPPPDLIDNDAEAPDAAAVDAPPLPFRRGYIVAIPTDALIRLVAIP